MILSERFTPRIERAADSLLAAYFHVYAIRYSKDAGDWWDDESQKSWQKCLWEIENLMLDMDIAKNEEDDSEYIELSTALNETGTLVRRATGAGHPWH